MTTNRVEWTTVEDVKRIGAEQDAIVRHLAERDDFTPGMAANALWLANYLSIDPTMGFGTKTSMEEDA